MVFNKNLVRVQACASRGSTQAGCGAARSLFKCVYPRRVNTDMIQYLPIASYKGKIDLVETDEQLDAALPEILRERILGFDTETRPNFSRNKHYLVSVLQLCGECKVWIIRLEPLKNRLSDIYEILENPAIKKVGLAVHGDILSLKERWLFSPAGFVDISKSTRSIGVINTGMRNLAALVLGVRVSKAAQLTNWASDSLTSKQLEYAATDAWISRMLFLEIKKGIETTSIAIEPEVREPPHFNFRLFVSGIIKSITKKIVCKGAAVLRKRADDSCGVPSQRQKCAAKKARSSVVSQKKAALAALSETKEAGGRKESAEKRARK